MFGCTRFLLPSSAKNNPIFRCFDFRVIKFAPIRYSELSDRDVLPAFLPIIQNIDISFHGENFVMFAFHKLLNSFIWLESWPESSSNNIKLRIITFPQFKNDTRYMFLPAYLNISRTYSLQIGTITKISKQIFRGLWIRFAQRPYIYTSLRTIWTNIYVIFKCSFLHENDNRSRYEKRVFVSALCK